MLFRSKHPGFREEREWRAVHNPLLFPTPLIKPSTQTIGGIPQLVYNLPLDRTVDTVLEDMDFAILFDRLIIGPTLYPIAMFDAIAEALTRAGVAEAGKKIIISDIPMRSS